MQKRGVHRSGEAKNVAATAPVGCSCRSRKKQEEAEARRSRSLCSRSRSRKKQKQFQVDDNIIETRFFARCGSRASQPSYQRPTRLRPVSTTGPLFRSLFLGWPAALLVDETEARAELPLQLLPQAVSPSLAYRLQFSSRQTDISRSFGARRDERILRLE